MTHAFSFVVTSSLALSNREAELARVRAMLTDRLAALLGSDDELLEVRDALRARDALVLNAPPAVVLRDGARGRYELTVTVERYEGIAFRALELGRRGVELLVRALHTTQPRAGYQPGWEFLSPRGPTLCALLETIAERDAVSEVFRRVVAPVDRRATLAARAKALRNDEFRRLRLAHLRETGQHAELVNLQLAYGFKGRRVERVFAIGHCYDDVAAWPTRDGLDGDAVAAHCRRDDADLLALLARLAVGASDDVQGPVLARLASQIAQRTRAPGAFAEKTVRDELSRDARALARLASLLAPARSAR